VSQLGLLLKPVKPLAVAFYRTTGDEWIPAANGRRLNRTLDWASLRGARLSQPPTPRQVCILIWFGRSSWATALEVWESDECVRCVTEAGERGRTEVLD
jgi:hypothetical protein